MVIKFTTPIYLFRLHIEVLAPFYYHDDNTYRSTYFVRVHQSISLLLSELPKKCNNLNTLVEVTLYINRMASKLFNALFYQATGP